VLPEFKKERIQPTIKIAAKKNKAFLKILLISIE
jgi:hypothetical protein